MEISESLIQYLIYAHAGLGGIALLSGSIAIGSRKGRKIHRTAGAIFYRSLLFSGLLALIIASLPGHFNPFLLGIGLFSLYLLICGYRALKFKKSVPNLLFDRSLAVGMFIVGILMLGLPFLLLGKFNIVLGVFGSIGVLSAIRDLRIFRKPEQLRMHWLRMHLGNMLGAYIASFTAFLVVNQFFPPLISWLAPTVIGTIYIVYWNKRLNSFLQKRGNGNPPH